MPFVVSDRNETKVLSTEKGQKQTKFCFSFLWYLWFSLTLILALRDRTWWLRNESELDISPKYFLLSECRKVLSLFVCFPLDCESFEGRHHVLFTIVTSVPTIGLTKEQLNNC